MLVNRPFQVARQLPQIRGGVTENLLRGARPWQLFVHAPSAMSLLLQSATVVENVLKAQLPRELHSQH
jgi:hypothetical protein